MRFDAFTRVIYAQYQGRLDRTPAAVLALVLIVIAVGILWAEQKTRGRAAYFSRKPNPPRPAHVRCAEGPRLVAYAFLAGLVAAAWCCPSRHW